MILGTSIACFRDKLHEGRAQRTTKRHQRNTVSRCRLQSRSRHKPPTHTHTARSHSMRATKSLLIPVESHVKGLVHLALLVELHVVLLRLCVYSLTQKRETYALCRQKRRASCAKPHTVDAVRNSRYSSSNLCCSCSSTSPCLD
jgi:hypothetical protein